MVKENVLESFRLLSELYSHLLELVLLDVVKNTLNLFPSPIGVIFSLILYSKKLLFAIVYKTIIV